jgi:hypothetical protein
MNPTDANAERSQPTGKRSAHSASAATFRVLIGIMRAFEGFTPRSGQPDSARHQRWRRGARGSSWIPTIAKRSIPAIECGQRRQIRLKVGQVQGQEERRRPARSDL